MNIKISLNGKPEVLQKAFSIEELINLKSIKREVVTIELNEVIVDRDKYNSTILKEGDRLEFVYYMGGGEN